MVKKPPSRMDIVQGFMEPSLSVYVMATDGAAIKVGYSNDPGQRVGDLQTGNGDVILIYWAIRLKSASARKLERAFHRKFAGTQKHLHGEWYYIPVATAVAWLRALAKDLKLSYQPDVFYGMERD